MRIIDLHTNHIRRTRRVVQGAPLLFFPVTLYYFSPVVPIFGLSIGVVSGSLLLFCALFLFSMVGGRLFCSWLCPMGAWQDVLIHLRHRRVTDRWAIAVRTTLWVVWLGLLVATLLRGGLRRGITVDPLFATERGISVTDQEGLIVLIAVVLLFGLIALALGRRGGCKTICWIAPFMAIGGNLGRRLGLPQLRLIEVPTGRCTACRTCTAACPMSLEPRLVAAEHTNGRIDDPRRAAQARKECILCAQCVQICPNGSLRTVYKP